MNLLSLPKINQRLEQFFSSTTEEIAIPFKTNKSTMQTTFNGQDLKKRYATSCNYIIDRILFYQKYKERGLVNISNVYVNISKEQLNTVIGNRKRLVSISILKVLGIIEVNEKYVFRSDNSLRKPFTKSYRIHPDYHDQERITIVSDPLKDHSKAINNNIKSDPLKEGKEGTMQMRVTFTNELDYLLAVHHKLGLMEVEPINITKSKVTGWIYSPVAGMERVKRNQLITRYDLVDIDICCAHLQFLLRLINDHLIDGSYTPLFGEHGINYFRKELETFKNKVMQNRFYNDLIAVFEKMGYWSKHNQRITEYQIRKGKDYRKDKIKQVVMTWLAGSHKDWKMIRYLNETYPQITHFINWYNQGTTKRLLTKLMFDEAQLINPIIQQLATTNSNAIICPIFDGFIVDREQAEFAYSRLIDEGTRMLGFPIMVKSSKEILLVAA